MIGYVARKHGALTSSRRFSSAVIYPLLPAGHLTTQPYGDAQVTIGSAYGCARNGFHFPEGSLATVAAVLQVFTPLLANACVGTLEPRAVAQPIIRLQVGWHESQRVQMKSRCTAALPPQLVPADMVMACCSPP